MIRPHVLFQGQLGKMWIPEQLASRRELTWNEKAVWARLARYEGKTGEARPKLETLAEELGISWDTAQRAVQALERHGLIRVTRRNFSRRPSLVEFLDHPWLRGALPQDAVAPPDPTPPQSAVAQPEALPQPAVTATANSGLARPQSAVSPLPQSAVAEGSQVKDLSEGSQVKGAPGSHKPDPKQFSAEQELWLELEACRIARCEELKIAPGKSKRPHPKVINAMFTKAAEHLGLVDRETKHGPLSRWDQLGDIFEEGYLQGEYGRDKKPPYPIELFCSHGVLDKARALHAKRAAESPTSEAAA